MTKLQVSAIASMLLAIVVPATAQTPLGTAFAYQGQLMEGGAPASGTYNLQFRLYDVPTGGAPLGSQSLPGTPVANGLFSVQLNGSGEFGGNAFNGEERWLEVEVNGTPLVPRQELTATPYALFSLNADKLDGLDSTAFLQSIPVPLTLSGTNPASHIISGANASTDALSVGVHGRSTATSGETYGGYFQSDSTQGRGVRGESTAASGNTSGVYGRSDSTSGRGVFGTANNSTTGAGVWGESGATSGRAVYGWAWGNSGTTTGVYGVSTGSPDGRGVFGSASASTGTTYGVFGQSDSTTGRGVYGLASAPSGSTHGGRFENQSSSGGGVYGKASAPSGLTFGGQFQSNSTSGRGVDGFAAGATGTTFGVHGQSNSTNGRGVYGFAMAGTGTTYGVYGQSESTSGYGVYGLNGASSGTIYGVRGYASTAASGYAVYAAGDMGASGTKPFRIDHPDDPENKYLLHYAAESPEVINFYSGKATLDGAGQAVVELPHYFAKINTDPRYTLTAVGAPMPMLHVAEEISEDALQAGEQAGPGDAPPTCWFRIAGGVAGGKVSWRVEALRNDLRVRLHGAPVEREKGEFERGKYQHPEYYGLGPEMGMDYQPERPGVAQREPEPASPPAPEETEQTGQR